jgi:hypothetical protein
MRLIILLLAAGIAGCSPAAAPDKAAPPPSADAGPALDLTCAGPFKAGMTRSDLVALFGATNVTDGVEGGPEGMEIPVSYLFASDPAKRAVVRWFEGPAATRTMSGVYADSLDPAWALPGGLKPGADIAAVEAANGRPFMLSGFGWDYGGAATDWKGGALGAGTPGCNVQVRFQHGQDVPEDALLSVSGDAGFSSDLPAMRAVAPLAAEIALGFPAPGAG